MPKNVPPALPIAVAAGLAVAATIVLPQPESAPPSDSATSTTPTPTPADAGAGFAASPASLGTNPEDASVSAEAATVEPYQRTETGAPAAGSVVKVATGAPNRTVIGNLTVTGAEAGGHLRVYPCDAKMPVTSHLNYQAGVTSANSLVVRTDAAGNFCVYTTSPAHILFDKTGDAPTSTIPTTVPKRLLDTRAFSEEAARQIDAKRQSMRDGGVNLGEPKGPVLLIRGGGLRGDFTSAVYKRNFTWGAVYWSPSFGARETHGGIWFEHEKLGGHNSKLGIPLADEELNFQGVKSRFEGGTIYWSGTPGKYTPAPGVNVAVNPELSGALPNPSGQTPDPKTSYTAQTAVGVGKTFLWWWKDYGQVPFSSLPRAVRAAGDGGPATQATISGATTMAADGRGGYYLVDTVNNLIRHVDEAGIIHTVAGNGSATPNPSCAYNRQALDVCLNLVHGVSVDPRDGGLILTDSFNQVVTKVNPNGWVTLLAGNGQICNPEGPVSACGEGGPATAAKLDRPTQSRMTPEGVLYISDSHNRILAVGADGVLRRVVGTGERGFSGDEGPATEAKIWAPADMVPYRGGLLVSDGNNCRLRWVDPQGVIHAFAGYGSDIHACWASYGEVHLWGKPKGDWGPQLAGDIGDGGRAVDGKMTVTGFFALKGDDVYVTDFLNNSVRRVTAADGTLSTVAGWTSTSQPESEGPVAATNYRLVWPSGLVLDEQSGVFYVGTGGRVAKLSPR